MPHSLKHLELVVHHSLIALNILFEDDLDSVLFPILLGFSNDAVCACSEGLAETIGSSKSSLVAGSEYEDECLLLVVAIGLPGELVKHTGDWRSRLGQRCTARRCRRFPA